MEHNPEVIIEYINMLPYYNLYIPIGNARCECTCYSKHKRQSPKSTPTPTHSLKPSLSLRRRTVESNEIGAPVLAFGHAAGRPKLQDARAERFSRVDILSNGKVQRQADDVRAGHGCTIKRFSGSGRANEGRLDTFTGREDVDGLAVVREGGLGPRRVNGADSNGIGSGSGRALLGEGVLVSRGDDGEDPRRISGRDSTVEGLGVAAT